jgi:hypothetical protein
MTEILLSNPLVILHVLYVVVLLPVVLWSDNPEPPRREGRAEPAGGLGARNLSCPGSRFRQSVTTAYHPREQAKLSQAIRP